jgi:hypothetical protein
MPVKGPPTMRRHELPDPYSDDFEGKGKGPARRMPSGEKPNLKPFLGHSSTAAASPMAVAGGGTSAEWMASTDEALAR